VCYYDRFRSSWETKETESKVSSSYKSYLYHNIPKISFRSPKDSRGPGFDSRALQKKVVGLERGSLSLVSTTEELLDRKVAAPV
jgi:hypothetical protein